MHTINPMYFDRNISENKDGKKMRAVHNLSCVTNGEFHFNIINFNANQIESTYIRNLHIFMKRKSYNPNFSNCGSILHSSLLSVFGLNATSTYDSYLSLIFGKFALI